MPGRMRNLQALHSIKQNLHSLKLNEVGSQCIKPDSQNEGANLIDLKDLRVLLGYQFWGSSKPFDQLWWENIVLAIATAWT